MQRYRSHKIVEAAKIAEILDQTIRFEGELGFRSTTQDWRGRFHWTLDDLGYFVQYEDGYISWSPTEAFENGHTLIPEGDVDTVVERDGTVVGKPIPALSGLRRS